LIFYILKKTFYMAELKGQATAEQIKEWNGKYPGGIYAVEFDEHVGYFKNPDRAEVNCALTKSDAKKPLAVLEDLANMTFIGGSDEVLKNDTLFLGVCNSIKNKMDGPTGRLVNL
jgi:hypothetical protein